MSRPLPRRWPRRPRPDRNTRRERADVQNLTLFVPALGWIARRRRAGRALRLAQGPLRQLIGKLVLLRAPDRGRQHDDAADGGRCQHRGGHHLTLRISAKDGRAAAPMPTPGSSERWPALPSKISKPAGRASTRSWSRQPLRRAGGGRGCNRSPVEPISVRDKRAM